MPRKIYKQTAFNAGELTPLIYSRIDVDKYDNGLKTGINCSVLPQGPLSRRNGTTVIAETKDADSTQALIKFQFNIDTNFTLEFGNLYVRFYDETSQIMDGGSPFEIVTPYTAAQVQDITYVQEGDTLYLAHPSHEPRTLTHTSDTVWTLALLDPLSPATFEPGFDPNVAAHPNATTGLAKEIYAGVTSIRTSAFKWTVSGSGTSEYYLELAAGGAPGFTEPNEVTANALLISGGTVGSLTASQWDWADNDTLGFSTVYIRLADSTDPDSKAVDFVRKTAGLIFLNGDIGRQFINSSGNGRASITSRPSTTRIIVDILEDFDDTSIMAAGTWLLDLSTIAELTSDGSSPGSIVTITADEIGTTNDYGTFRVSDVGSYIRMNSGIIRITEFTNAFTVKGEVIKGLTSLDETEDWTLEAESWDATRGFPRAVALFQNRLWFGGTVAQPQTLWASETGLLDRFGVGTNDDDALEVSLSSKVAAQINWMAASRDLVVGTSGAEHTVNASSSNAAITPTSIQQVARTYIGSNTQTPLVIESEVLFISKSKRKVRSFRYDFNIDGYQSEDLLFLAEHLPTSNIVSIAYASEPFSQIYAVLAGGDMLVASYVRTQQVIGWTKYTTDGDYRNVQTITSGSKDDTWITVERDVNGTDTTFMERFDSGIGDNAADVFSDGAIVHTGSEKVITAITKASPGVVTATAHGFSDGDRVRLSDVLGMTEVNNTTFIVANKTANTFELTTLQAANVDTSGFTTYTSGGLVNELFLTVTNTDFAPLEGATVQVKADNAVHPDAAVASNAITLTYFVHEIVIGRSYTTTIEPLSQNFDIGFGPMRSQRSRHVNFGIEVYRSAAPLVNNELVPIRTSADPMDQALALFSGFLKYGNMNWDDAFTVSITQSRPLPLTLLGIFSIADGGLR